jgi:hypothetical protein
MHPLWPIQGLSQTGCPGSDPKVSLMKSKDVPPMNGVQETVNGLVGSIDCKAS